jgi:peroxiredoxin
LSEVVLAEADTAAQQQEQLAAWLGNIQDSAEVEILYEPPSAAPVIGAIAPDFTLTNLVGEEVSLSDFRGRPVVVNFWATWCVPCRREMPAFQRAFEAYQADDLVILALDLEETAAQVEPFVEELGLTFEVLYDSQGEVNDTYQVTGLPRTVFIDRQGVIRHIQVGEVQEVLLEGFLDRIL